MRSHSERCRRNVAGEAEWRATNVLETRLLKTKKGK